MQVEDVEFLGQTFAWGAEQMKTLGILLTMLGWVQAAAAFNADDYRGGWETYGNDGALHIYEFSIRADRVRGVYCTDCSDATTLAFVDGKVETDGISFLVTHVKDDGSTAYQEHATAKYENGQLLVAGTRDGTGGGAFRWTMRKDPRGPAPVAEMMVSKLPAVPPAPPEDLAPNPPPGAAEPRRVPQPYTAPGPWEPLSDAKVVGVWLGFGAGIDKQFFIIRKVGNSLRGLACGRCDNPYTMGALDDFHIQGNTLPFNILHEDWGPGALPSHNQVTAHVAKNEMRISTLLDNRPAGSHGGLPGFEVQTSLMGPIAIRATAAH